MRGGVARPFDEVDSGNAGVLTGLDDSLQGLCFGPVIKGVESSAVWPVGFEPEKGFGPLPNQIGLDAVAAGHGHSGMRGLGMGAGGAT